MVRLTYHHEMFNGTEARNCPEIPGHERHHFISALPGPVDLRLTRWNTGNGTRRWRYPRSCCRKPIPCSLTGSASGRVATNPTGGVQADPDIIEQEAANDPAKISQLATWQIANLSPKDALTWLHTSRHGADERDSGSDRGRVLHDDARLAWRSWPLERQNLAEWVLSGMPFRAGCCRDWI